MTRKVVRQAEKYAGMTCSGDSEVFVVAAQIDEANQLAVADGSTVFERTRGFKAISMFWDEDCAETFYRPIARLFVPGEGSVACNILCDFIV